jgi:acetyl-CoA carboxylase alpha subunit
MALSLKKALKESLARLDTMTLDEVTAARYQKYMQIGNFKSAK